MATAEPCRVRELDRQLLDLVAERARLTRAAVAAAVPAGARPRVQDTDVLREHSRMHTALDHAEALGLCPGDAAVVLTAVSALCRNAAFRGGA